MAKNDFEVAYEAAAFSFRGKDITLRMPVGGEGFWILWDKKISPRFTELTGIKTQFESANYEQVYGKTFLDLGAKSGTYDVFDLNFTWFGQFMAAEGLALLEPWLSDPKMPKVDVTGYIPALLDTYGKWEGKLYGLPLIADAMIFPYNKTHFTDAGLDPEKPPTTWDEVYTYGKQLMKGDRAGFALMGGRQIGDVHLCRNLLRPGAQALLQRRRHLSIRQPRGPAGDGHYRHEATGNLPARRHDLGHQPGFGSGRTGQVLDGDPVPGILQSLVDPKAPVAGQMGYAAPPGGTALGGHGVGVSNYSKNKDAAYLFSAYTTAPEIQKQYVADGYAISWQSLFTYPEVQKANPYIVPFGKALASGIGWPKTEETPQIFDIMVKHISSAISKQATTKAALDAMNAEINALRKEKGYIT